MKKLYVVLTLLIIILLNTCNDNPVNPSDNIPPGRRDYVWTVDTIPVLNASMRDIWGSSPTDIWICGDADNRRESVWHYDGNNFTPSGEYILAPTSLWGSASDNIWLGTVYSQLWHYDGVSWTKYTDLKYPGYTDVVIQSIYGTAPNDIYATGMADSFDGYRGVILHFDGSVWEYVNIPDIRVNFSVIKYDLPSKTYLLRGANFDNIGKSERLYSYKNNDLRELYAGDIGIGIGKINRQVYIYKTDLASRKASIYYYENQNLVLWKNFDNTIYIGGISGRSTKDFFFISWGNADSTKGVGHYNGINLVTIYPAQVYVGPDIIFDTKVIFLLKHLYTDQDFILNGKLEIN